MKLRATIARESTRWTGLAETDLWEKIAEIVPPAPVLGKRTKDALQRLKDRHAGDPAHAEKVEQYVAEVYEARRAYGERSME